MYAGSGRRAPLAGGAWESLLHGWDNPRGLGAAPEGLYLSDLEGTSGLLYLARTSSDSATGWESKAVKEGLDSPGAVCGVAGGKVYLITGMRRCPPCNEGMCGMRLSAPRYPPGPALGMPRAGRPGCLAAAAGCRPAGCRWLARRAAPWHGMLLGPLRADPRLLPRPACCAGATGTTNGGGTKLTAIDTSTYAATDIVTGLTDALACAMDAAGSGDVLIADGADLLVLPASASRPATRAGLTLTKTFLYALVDVAGYTSGAKAGTYFACVSGYSPDFSATTRAGEIVRIAPGGTTTVL